MSDENQELDRLQGAYKAAVERWIDAIRREEALASVDHSIADVDKWEEAHMAEETLRKEVEHAKVQYEAAIRSKFFGF